MKNWISDLKNWIRKLCDARDRSRNASIKISLHLEKIGRNEQLNKQVKRRKIVLKRAAELWKNDGEPRSEFAYFLARAKQELDRPQKIRYIACIIFLSVLSFLLIHLVPQFRIKIPENNFSELDFLAVIIALSAYLAGVRLAILGRLGSDPKPTDPSSLKRRILFLIPSDFNLIISGFIVAAKLFYANVFPVICWAEPFAIPLFIYAVLYLGIMHIISWFESARKYYE